MRGVPRAIGVRRCSSSSRRRGSASALEAPSYGTQVVGGLLALAAVQLAERWPRGYLSAGAALEVRESSVAGAGRGVFCASPLAANTILGSYPGRQLSVRAYKRKLESVPAASGYCWTSQDRLRVLDPTDGAGKLCEPLCWLDAAPWLRSVPTTLALINEPGVGGDVNVRTYEVEGEVLFVTERDLYQGEELFLDYGLMYDRSSYGR